MLQRKCKKNNKWGHFFLFISCLTVLFLSCLFALLLRRLVVFSSDNENNFPAAYSAVLLFAREWILFDFAYILQFSEVQYACISMWSFLLQFNIKSLNTITKMYYSIRANKYPALRWDMISCDILLPNVRST